MAEENGTADNAADISDAEGDSEDFSLTAQEDADPVAQIGSEEYATLPEAVQDANDGDTIVIYGDVELTETLTIDKKLTIEFKRKYSISGSFESDQAQPLLRVKQPLLLRGSVDNAITTKGSAAVGHEGSGELTIDGPTIHADRGSTICQTSAARRFDELKLLISNGVVSSDAGTAIDFTGPAYCDADIRSGHIEGETALKSIAGEGSINFVDISGGELVGTTASLDLGYRADTKVSGGTFCGPVVSTDPTKFVSGGTFRSTDNSVALALDESYVADGYAQDMSTGKVMSADKIPAFVSQQLVLTGQVGLTALLRLPEDAGVNWATSYVTFEVSGRKHRTVEVPYADSVLSEDGLHGFIVQLSSVEMAEPITATLHYELDGQEATLTKEGISVENYVKKFDESASSFDDKTVALVHALADYGHWVQPFLSKQNKWTLGDGDDQYAEMGTFYTQSYDVEEAKAVLSDYGMSKDLGSSAVTKATANLALESDTTLEVALTTEGGTRPTNVTASVGGDTFEVEAVKSGKKWRLRVPGIRAQNLREDVTFAGTAGSGVFTVTVSPLAYAGAVLKAGTYGTEAETAMCALWQYHLATFNYCYPAPRS